MKKIPPKAEASNVLIGEVDSLQYPISAFIRLQQALILGDLTEASSGFWVFSLYSKRVCEDIPLLWNPQRGGGGGRQAEKIRLTTNAFYSNRSYME